MQSSATIRTIERARAGCRRAFARLWTAHAAKVRAVVARAAPAGVVEDVVQDVALAALHGIAAFRADGDFAGWLLSIARNRAVSARQRLRRQLVRLDGGALDAVPAADADERLRGDRRQVLGLLRRLPRAYRRPLWLRFVGDCSAAEIASRLGSTEGAVRVSLCRGLRRLRGMLPRPAAG